MPDQTKFPFGDRLGPLSSSRPARIPITGIDPSQALEANLGLSLSLDEREVSQGLTQFDPQLAGLYILGVRLIRQIDSPGVPFLIGHIGRELSRGLIRALNGGGLSLPFDDRDAEIENERNRLSIAGAFQAPLDHPLVREWFRCVEIFTASSHFQSPGPKREGLLEAFTLFTQMLKGRVSPFFPNHAELRKLMEIPSPVPEQLERLRTLLIHPQQRKSFYSDLQHPAWLQPLMNARFLQPTPGFRQQDGGLTTPVPWYEAHYIIRMAKHHPDQVLEIIKGISPANQNPLVWQAVLNIAIQLPQSFASSIIGLFKNGFLVCPPWFIASQVIDLIEYWASAGQSAAFKLALILTHTAGPEIGTLQEEGASKPFRISGRRHEGIWRYLDSHHMQRFVEKGVPALEQLDGMKTLEFLLKRIQRALVPDKSAAVDYQEAAKDCQRWCESLESADPNGDIRGPLVVHACRIARQIALADETSAREVWRLLARREHPIFERIRYLVLADAGPFLQDHLDLVISDGRLLSPPFRYKEAAQLLRAQFSNASTSARFLFKHALERGLDPSELVRYGTSAINNGFAGGEETLEPSGYPSPGLLMELNTEWQQRRLRWFQEKIPPELLEISIRLGVSPSMPSEEQRALDEIGRYYTGGTWRGERSPKSTEQLAGMSLDEVVSFLLAWAPSSQGQPSRFHEGPTTHGLKRELSEFAKSNLAGAIQIGLLGISRGVHPGYLEALIAGITKGVEGTSASAVEEGLNLLAKAVSLTPHLGSSSDRENPDSSELNELRTLHRACLDQLRLGCKKDLFRIQCQEQVWGIIESAIKDPKTWVNPREEAEEVEFKELLHRAINTLGGECTDTLFDIARWHHRALTNAKENPIGVIEANEIVWPKLLPLLQVVISQSANDKQGVSAVIGQELPFVWYLSPSWFHEHIDELCLDGVEDPDQHPLWGAFLTTGQIYPELFHALRHIYVRTTVRYASGDPFRPREEWSITGALGKHVVGMMLYGHCAIGDSDHLIESTFDCMSIEERSHCYWWASQGMAPEEPEIQAGLARSATALWDWRLSVLETSPVTPEKKAEAGGLLWMLRTPEIPVNDAIRLGLRNLEISKGEEYTHGLFWDRLSEIASTDPGGALSISEILIGRELVTGHGYLPFDEVAPILSLAMNAGDHELRERALVLINKLGEHGLMEYGSLLN